MSLTDNTSTANAGQAVTLTPADNGGPSTHPAHLNPADPTDGRNNLDYKSKYPLFTRFQIFVEAFYLAMILIISFYFLIWIFAGDMDLWRFTLKFKDLNINLQQMAAFSTAGFIGGSMFGLKYLYRVAARGWWHEDRRIWRIFSPLLSATLSTMIGILIEGGIVHVADAAITGNAKQSLSTSFVSIGFITGYFADTALAKLQEIAMVLFGSKDTSSQQK